CPDPKLRTNSPCPLDKKALHISLDPPLAGGRVVWGAEVGRGRAVGVGEWLTLEIYDAPAQVTRFARYCRSGSAKLADHLDLLAVLDIAIDR
ncbi:hypothetical protein ACFPJ1_24645, partial [Kribbella qitaiheensis]|uniref:hypothetical protein n=1 Tax=Kribbella qitaiheensis TaxID=1544730 RepID=UPI00361BDF44